MNTYKTLLVKFQQYAGEASELKVTSDVNQHLRERLITELPQAMERCDEVRLQAMAEEMEHLRDIAAHLLERQKELNAEAKILIEEFKETVDNTKITTCEEALAATELNRLIEHLAE